MSLLKKASIITTPTAYAEDYLYSIKPAQSLGENLDVLPSADSAVGNHYKFSPYGNNTVQYVNGETIITYVDNTSGAFHYFQTSYNLSQNLTVGRRYKVEINFKVNTGSFNWQYYTGTSTISLESSTNTDFQTISYSYTAGHASNTWVRTQNFTSGQIVTVRKITIQEVTDADFDFDRNSTGTRVNEDYLIETVATNTPRIDYTNGEPSILLEPSRTNSYTHNNNFTDSSWDKVNSTFIANQINSPDGILNAGKLIPSTSNTFHRIEKSSFNGVRNTIYTFSVFVKSAGINFIQVATSSGFDLRYQNFNLAEGKKASGDLLSSNYECDIISYPDDWYRISVTATASVSDNSRFLLIPITTDGARNANFAGDGTSGVYIYGIQHEAGSYATSLIHTSGSAVTRSKDEADNAGDSDLINSSEGVFYAEIKANSNDETGRQITISDGTTQNNVQIKYIATDNVISGSVKSGDVFEAILNYTAINALEYHKVAVKYKVNDFALWIDGKEVGTDSSGSVPVGMKQLNFDNGGGANDFLGNCKMVAVFKEALSDTELACLTGYNNHELYMNYYNRLSYLGLVEEYNVESDINNYIL